MCVAFVVVWALLAGRLAVIQVRGSASLARLALEQRLERLGPSAIRGDVFDRRGRRMTGAFRRPTVAVFPRLVTDPETFARSLASSLGGGAAEASVIERLFRGRTTPFRIRPSDLGPAEETGPRSPLPDGAVAFAEKQRYDPGGLACHLIGQARASDNRGVSGVEAACDSFLAAPGRAGVAAVVDANRRLVAGLGYREDCGGSDNVHGIGLTVDLEVQASVEECIDRAGVRRGAAVVMDCRTGEILAMVSRPRFTPGAAGVSGAAAGAYLNRALAAYEPGSVFKIAVAAAALESGACRPSDTFYDPGFAQVGGRVIRCYSFEQGGHGVVSLADAMAVSCNTAFVNLGVMVGPGRLIEVASRMGFGRPTGLGLAEEAPGRLPDPSGLTPGDLANVSIGQGDVLATPLQVACATATIASGGVAVPPVVIDRLTDPDGRCLRRFKRRPPVRVLSGRTARELASMFEAVVDTGTGTAAQVVGIGTAGKTGTAQTPTGQPHAWFAGYAPREDPWLVVVVFVENGGSGGRAAAPVFRDIVKAVMGSG